MAAATDVPGPSAAPGPTGHPKGSPAERVKMQVTKIGQELATLYQECHELTGGDSPECNAVHIIQRAVAELGAHIGKNMHEMPAEPAAGPPAPPDAGPPMGASPFAGAARGLHQDMMAPTGP